MFDALNFVRGAVATSDLVPELTHFRIVNHSVMAYNGTVAAFSPIDISLDACPHAATFIKALKSCGDKIALSLTPTGRLAVSSGKFKAYVSCIDAVDFTTFPAGDIYLLPDDFIDACKIALPFVGDDVSRPWSTCVHLQRNTLHATNNKTAVRLYFQADFPAVTIPANALRQIVAGGHIPLRLQTDGESATFHFENGAWLRTQLMETAWPVEQFGRMLDQEGITLEAAPPDLFKGIKTIQPFVEAAGAVLFNGGHIATNTAEGLGAVFDVPGCAAECAYNIKQLLLLETVADRLYMGGRAAYFAGKRGNMSIIGITTAMLYP